MDPLIIGATDVTPKINFDGREGVMEITGVSYDEDTLGFFQPVLEWLKQYKNNPQQETELNIHFKYFNSATSKALYDVLSYFARIREAGFKVTINWYYEKEDESMRDEIEYFSELVEVPITLKEV